MKIEVPAVSIVIPMYNAEKYVAECLDSILAQTFQDYEVIIVDDASTDKSRDIVTSYLPKFTREGVECLKLICSEKNSGRAGIPRNKAFKFARGEYIMFLDSDDAITETAIEELYPIAKKFDADALYIEKYYEISETENFTTDKNLLKTKAFFNVGHKFVSEPELVPNDIARRVEDFAAYKFSVTSWSYFVRREFISMHDLRFPDTKYANDNFFTMSIVCLAKNLVRVPNATYIYRILNNSISHDIQPLNKFVPWYTDHFFQGVDIVRKFADELPELKERPDLQYKLFEFFAQRGSVPMASLYEKNPAWEMKPFIAKEIDKINDKTTLATVIFARMNQFAFKLHQQSAYFQDTLVKAQEVIEKQQAKIDHLEDQMGYYRKALEQAIK